MSVKFLLACDTHPKNPWERDRLPAIRKAIAHWDHDIIDIYEFNTREEAHRIHEQKGKYFFNDYNVKEINEKFYDKIKSYNCNILILATVDNYARYLIPSTIKKLQNNGVFVVGILGDDEFTFTRNRFYVPMFDVTIAYVKQFVDKYNQIKPESCKYLPNSCYFKEKDFKKLQKDESCIQNDVIFFGTPFGNRPKIMESLVDEDIDIAIFGSRKWNNYNKLKDFYHGYIESDNMDTAIHESKIVLALLEDHLTGKNHMNTKIWEAIRNGRMPIATRYTPLIEDYNLVENKEIIMYDSIEDLVNKLKYYLNNPRERISITKNLFERIKSDFDYEDLYYNLFENLEKDHFNTAKKEFIQIAPLITIIDHSKNGGKYEGFCYLRSPRTKDWRRELIKNYFDEIKTPYVIFTDGDYDYSPYINDCLFILSRDKIIRREKLHSIIHTKKIPLKYFTDINEIVWERETFFNDYLNKIKINKYIFNNHVYLCDIRLCENIKNKWINSINNSIYYFLEFPIKLKLKIKEFITKLRSKKSI